MAVKRMVFLAVIGLLFFSAPARAVIGDEVAKDFQPVSGYVITAMQGEYLIDLDASQRLAIGDIFAVVQPGEQIVHPVTKKVIGSVEEAKAYLQVTRIQSGYSYTRLLGKDEGASIKPGDVVRRFQNLPALFWDYSGRGEATFAELQTALPHLEWADYASAQASRPAIPAPPAEQRIALTFIYDGSRVEVRDPYFRIIHTYGTKAASADAGEAAPATPLVTSRGMKLQPAPPSGPAYSAPQSRPPASAQPRQGVPYQLDQQPRNSAPGGGGVTYEAGGPVSYAVSFPGYQNIGALPPGIMYSDFIVDQGRRLMAATNGSTIYVFDLTNGVQRLDAFSLPYTCQMLSVHWWKASADEPLRLAVNGWISKDIMGKQLRTQNNIFASLLLVFEDDELRLIKDKIRYALGTLDRDGDDLPELLLGQDYDKRTFLGRDIWRGQLKDGELEKADPGIPLPLDFPVVGSSYVDLTGDGRPELAYVRNNVLYIYSSDAERRLYESPKQMGGSPAKAMFDAMAGNIVNEGLSEYFTFELRPVASDLDGDQVPELLLPCVEEIAYGLAEGLSKGVKKSWLGVIKFRDGMFIKGTIGEKLEIPLAGLTVTPEAVWFVASEATSMLGEKGDSFLLSFPLK